MTRYLLDTGPAQQFINNHAAVRQHATIRKQSGDIIDICVPVLGELWSGVEGSSSRDANLKRLKHSLGKLVLWPYDAVAAAEFGRIFNVLKKAGRPMQQIDIQIAAIALTLGSCRNPRRIVDRPPLGQRRTAENINEFRWRKIRFDCVFHDLTPSTSTSNPWLTNSPCKSTHEQLMN